MQLFGCLLVEKEFDDNEMWNKACSKKFELLENEKLIGIIYFESIQAVGFKNGSTTPICVTRVTHGIVPRVYIRIGLVPDAMSHRDFRRLLHEFGHALHMMYLSIVYDFISIDSVIILSILKNISRETV